MTSEAHHDDDISRRLAAGEIDDLTAAPMHGQNMQAGPGTGPVPLRPRYSARRVLCGAWWALGTLLFAISALISLFGGHFLQFLGAMAIAGLVGWYDYRVWTFKTKWLMFLIIF
jgi:hypothetical protein